MRHPLRLAAALVLLVACGSRVDIAATGGGAGGSGAGVSTTGSGAAPGTTGSGAGATSGTTGVGAGTSSGNGGAGAGTTGTTGVGAGTTGSGGAAMICQDFGDPCTSCVSVACPAIYCACSDNPECFALSTCFSGCPDDDQACNQACQTKHPDGISDLYKLSGCAGSSCPSECPGNDPLSPCIACVLDECPGALNACLADPACVALYNCLDACPDVDLVCQQGCYGQFGAGTAKLTALLQCESAPCGPICK